MIWVILALVFFALAVYLHKSADRLETTSYSSSQGTNKKPESESYWEQYQRDHPSKAKSISSQIHLSFTTMSDRDVKEIISSAERLASSLKCDISGIREHYLKEISKYPVELLPEMIASTSREADKEAMTFGIAAKNTMSSIMVIWLRERHDEFGKPDAEVSKEANEDEIEIVKELCPLITDKVDVQERLKSLREMSLLWKCPLKDLKDYYIGDVKKSYDGSYENFHYLPEAFKQFAFKAYEVADKADVKSENTSYGILCDWLSEFMKEERKRLLESDQVRCPRCGSRKISLSFFGDEFECKSCDIRFGGL